MAKHAKRKVISIKRSSLITRNIIIGLLACTVSAGAGFLTASNYRENKRSKQLSSELATLNSIKRSLQLYKMAKGGLADDELYQVYSYIGEDYMTKKGIYKKVGIDVNDRLTVGLVDTLTSTEILPCELYEELDEFYYDSDGNVLIKAKALNGTEEYTVINLTDLTKGPSLIKK